MKDQGLLIQPSLTIKVMPRKQAAQKYDEDDIATRMSKPQKTLNVKKSWIIQNKTNDFNDNIKRKRKKKKD